MSNYNSLKTTINANVKQNGVQAITGQILNSVLNAMVTTLGTGYQFAGVATTATDPGSPDAKVFYIANGKGTYTNFGGVEVTEDDVVVLYWDSSWHKVSTGIASQAKLSELEDLKETILIKKFQSANLANPQGWLNGFINNNGYYDSSSSYCYQEIDVRKVATGTILTCITDANVSASPRYYCFKDDAMGNGQKIEGGQSVNTFAVPEGATKLYISYSVGYLSDKQIGVFMGEASWSPYFPSYMYPYGDWDDTDDANALVRIKDIPSVVPNSSIRQKDMKSSNMFDYNLLTDGLINQNGFYDGASTYSYLEIDVTDVAVGETMTCIRQEGNTPLEAMYYCFKNDVMGNGQKIEGGIRATRFVKPSGATRLYVSMPKSVINLYSAENIGVFVGQTPIFEFFENIEKYSAAMWSNVPKDTSALARLEDVANSNVLYGKKWAVLGDSFTAGSESAAIESGKYKGKNKVYPYFIGNRNNMDILKFFESGRTLAYPSDGAFDNSVCCPSKDFYYQNIPVDVDYVTIYLGINDSHHNTNGGSDGEDYSGAISLGTIDDTTTATYYGAWNTILGWLREYRPYAHVGIMITNGLVYNYNGDEHTDFYDAQKAIAKKWGIPYIDLNGDERTPCMLRSCNSEVDVNVRKLITMKQSVNYIESGTTGDNRHPNDETHLYESLFIENWLRSL